MSVQFRAEPVAQCSEDFWRIKRWTIECEHGTATLWHVWGYPESEFCGDLSQAFQRFVEVYEADEGGPMEELDEWFFLEESTIPLEEMIVIFGEYLLGAAGLVVPLSQTSLSEAVNLQGFKYLDYWLWPGQESVSWFNQLFRVAKQLGYSFRGNSLQTTQGLMYGEFINGDLYARRLDLN